MTDEDNDKYMLAKPQRLARDNDFKKIFKQGKSYYSKLLGVKAIATRRSANRYGIIISAKISKKARERNRLKRQISQALKELDKRLAPGLDLVVVVLPAMLGQEFKAIKNELAVIFKKLKLFK